jgi:hypothetical protein
MATLRVKGLPELIKKTGPALYVDPLNRTIKDGAKAFMAAAQRRAPRATGQLASSLSERFDPQPLGLVSAAIAMAGGANTWLPAVALNAGRRIVGSRRAAAAEGYSVRRYRYSKGGRRFRNKAFNAPEVTFHYRSGALKGRVTRRWLTGIPSSAPIKREVEGLVQRAAREVEAAWQR